jgi:hypothetical protein
MTKHSEKIKQMKAAGTYCEENEPDLSFLNFRHECRYCPNYYDCKSESEKQSRNILKYRRGEIQKPKTKRHKK